MHSTMWVIGFENPTNKLISGVARDLAGFTKQGFPVVVLAPQRNLPVPDLEDSHRRDLASPAVHKHLVQALRKNKAVDHADVLHLDIDFIARLGGLKRLEVLVDRFPAYQRLAHD